MLPKQKRGSVIIVNKIDADVSTRSVLKSNFARKEDKRKTGRRIEARRFLRSVFSLLRLVGLPFFSQPQLCALLSLLLLRNILLHRLQYGRADLSEPILLPIVHPQLLQ